MISTDFTKLSREQLMEHFEQERQEWLTAGMSEVDIFRIHFGTEEENGKGGDYRIWLDERKHTRSDRKYAPGTPVAIDTVDPSGAWISGGRSGLDDEEFGIDLETALSDLPTAQRELVEAIVFDGITPAEYAKRKRISKAAVSQTLSRVRKNLKFFFNGIN